VQAATNELDCEQLAQFEWLRSGIAPECLRDAQPPDAVDWRRAITALAVSFALAVFVARVFS